MANKRTLHKLRLLIPGEVQIRQIFSQNNRVLHYFWSCGCIAYGMADEELLVRHCDLHYDSFELQYAT